MKQIKTEKISIKQFCTEKPEFIDIDKIISILSEIRQNNLNQKILCRFDSNIDEVSILIAYLEQLTEKEQAEVDKQNLIKKYKNQLLDCRETAHYINKIKDELPQYKKRYDNQIEELQTILDKLDELNIDYTNIKI